MQLCATSSFRGGKHFSHCGVEIANLFCVLHDADGQLAFDFDKTPFMDGVNPVNLFEALDGYRLSVASRYWHIEIYGVFEQMGVRWMQLILQGSPAFSLAVKVDASATRAEIIEMLSAWLACPSRANERVLCLG